MRILLGYPWFPSEAYGDVRRLHEDYILRLRVAGFDVEGFCLTLHPPGGALTFPELDLLWRWGDRTLLDLYSRLEAALEGCDVFLNCAGINVHPAFVEQLPVITVFQCFDDPEASALLSRPVANSYDLCLVGNAAEVETYRAWGARAEWAPMGLMPGIYDPELTETHILEGKRDIDIAMLSDRSSPWRRQRLDHLAAAFPAGRFHGKGWPLGYLPIMDQVALLQHTKIGPNLHNSTGPVNYRTFYLPANGVLQVCDNRSHLASAFTLGTEVIGFDTVEECIDQCRYYLAHDRERREIAAAGWRRAMRDYTEEAVFRRKIADIRKHFPDSIQRPSDRGIAARRRDATVIRAPFAPLANATRNAAARTMRVLKRLSRSGSR